MKHLGDITQIKGYTIDPVDVVVAGSPCQDLSIAGKRAGLEGGRSGLFMDSIRIVKEMRANTGGEQPKYFIWENVPGAFSSNKGEDFRVVLEELAKIKDIKISIPRPNKEGKWDTAGCIMGEGFSIAWRVMDAQYWGVPQRRRRISLVMDFRGQTAPEILFESNGLQWNFAKGRTERQGTTEDIAGGIGTSCYEWHNQDSRITGPIETACTLNTNAGGGKGALIQTDKSATLSTLQDQTLFEPVIYAFDSLSSNSMKSANPVSGCREIDIAKCIDTTYPCPSKNQGGMAVVEPVICLQGNGIDRADTAGCNGKGWNDESCYTLNTIDRPTVCYSRQRSDELIENTVTPTQSARQYKDATDLIVEKESICFDNRSQDEGEPRIYGDFAPTLSQRMYKDPPCILQHIIRYIVRRITPLECERLQGFPDLWTEIGAWTDSKGKLHKESSDSARYKALGNSIALPQWVYVLGNMSLYLPLDATLGSLFDGIGGFPLVWSWLHGKDKCLWASEIEEFPIAVTKYHFGEEQENKQV